MAVPASEWLRLLREEYLDGFIRSGGSAVKIAVVPDAMRFTPVLGRVAETAATLGYPVAVVDAATTKVSRIDTLFHEVARQMDWDALAERWLGAQLRAAGVEISPDRPLPTLDEMVEASGQRRADLVALAERIIANGILRDYTLTREFRTAVAMLCRHRINPYSVSPSDAESIKGWLRGEKPNLTALKRLQIYQRVGRHNARLLLASLARWLHLAGHPGLVVLIDLSAVVAPPRPEEELPAVRYGRSAILDVYEVLRQCLDEMEDTPYLLLVAVAGAGLLDDPRRSVDNYTALKLRTADEVRDRDRANPLSTLVRLEGAAEGSGYSG
jgi:hypothetical protein